jgi:peptidoglycan/LPS O-acetylase OafA/YrhL
MTEKIERSNLDLLRAIAVLLVLLNHVLDLLVGPGRGQAVMAGEARALGRAGVLMFFVHTSLVLMQSLERTKLSGKLLFAQFYIKRVFRIYPLSIAMVLFFVVLSLPMDAWAGRPYVWRGMGFLAANIFLYQNVTWRVSVLSPLWSLPFEVQMYLVLPLIFVAMRARKSLLFLFAIYAGSVPLARMSPVLRFVPCFLAGVIAYRILRIIQPRFRAMLWLPAILGIVGLYIVVPTSIFSQTKDPFSQTKDTLFCLMVGLAIPLFQDCQGLLAAAAAQVAKYSYGVYLGHTAVFLVFFRYLEMADWMRVVCSAIGIALVSIFCFHAIERPMMNLGSRMADRVAQRVPAQNSENVTDALVKL